MVKTRTEFQCEQCGSRLNKWAGQCPDCQAWNSIVETLPQATRGRRVPGLVADDRRGVTNLAEVGEVHSERFRTGIQELDRVLGGGIVPGSVLLLGGDPGIGKSTLLLQMIAALGDRTRSLYITGEESLEQIGMRARRLGLSLEGLRCLAETDVDRMLEVAVIEKPQLMVVDSIQTTGTEELTSAPGSVSQVRESAARLVKWAKENHCCVVMVGHVTKDGTLAGPRVLEHMVDAVLYFESDAGSRHRLVRAVKNRFGAVNELAMFAMTGKGLKEVSNPSAIFLSGNEGPVSGSVITIIREGTRPILLEVQALVDQSHLNNPRRVTVGLEQNRLAMMLAVLHRHAGLTLGDQDVFINVVGGLRILETAEDMPMILALFSSFRDKPLPACLVCFGEVGLSGEVRPVHDGQDRLREASSHGFKYALIPAGNATRQKLAQIEVLSVRNVSEAIDKITSLGS